MTTELKKPTTSLPVMQVTVMGRIEASRRYDGQTYTRILTPAADAYSRPQVLEVRSKTRLGDKGDEVNIRCQLGGYTKKAYKFTDKETGELMTIVPVDHTLDLLE